MQPQERQRKILVMDDEESVLEVIQQMLSRSGFEVVVTMDKEAAIEAFRQAQKSNAPFELVILDLQADLSLAGVKTLEDIKAIDPNVKAILSTGSSVDPVVYRYREIGFSGVLNKPFGMQQLLDLIQDIIG